MRPWRLLGAEKGGASADAFLKRHNDIFGANRISHLQGFTIRPVPGCMQFEAEVVSKWFTKPRNGLIVKPCTAAVLG